MRFVLLFLIFTSKCYGQSFWQQLKPTKLELISLGLGTIDGISRGTLEAYHSNPHIFENKFGVDKYSFWGSEAWQRNYNNNRYKNFDGTINSHKHEYLGNFGRDVWHTFGDISKLSGRIGYLSFGVSQFKKNKKILPIIIKVVILSGFSSFVEKVTYDYLK